MSQTAETQEPSDIQEGLLNMLIRAREAVFGYVNVLENEQLGNEEELALLEEMDALIERAREEGIYENESKDNV